MAAAVCAFLFAFTLQIFAQEPLPTARMPEESTSHPFGVGLKVSSLGAGIEIGAGITQSLNLRVGGDFFDYSVDNTRDGVTYNGNVRLHSLEAHVDWFPWKGNFHVGPGVLYHLTQPLDANLQIPGGTLFTLNATDFVSSPNDPVSGAAALRVHHIAPEVTVGWGDLLPRGEGKHWSIPFEIGAAFQGNPQILLGLQGTACSPHGGPCYDAATNPVVLTPLSQEIKKRQNDISWFKIYPLISIGVGYRF
jgi:hypothetical protein